jgi:hypothetical protein
MRVDPVIELRRRAAGREEDDSKQAKSGQHGALLAQRAGA